MTARTGARVVTEALGGTALSRAILASFLAPRAEFRSGLIRSLFDADRNQR